SGSAHWISPYRLGQSRVLQTDFQRFGVVLVRAVFEWNLLRRDNSDIRGRLIRARRIKVGPRQCFQEQSSLQVKSILSNSADAKGSSLLPNVSEGLLWSCRSKVWLI